MRLRPDGSRGILVNDIEGYRNYYMKSAHIWEVQSLLRARIIAGDKNLLKVLSTLKKADHLGKGQKRSVVPI